MSVEALSRKLRDMRTDVTPRLSASKRQRFLGQLEVWEEWLVGPARDEVRHDAELKHLQKEIQFLRLDLLKSGGF